MSAINTQPARHPAPRMLLSVMAIMSGLAVGAAVALPPPVAAAVAPPPPVRQIAIDGTHVQLAEFSQLIGIFVGNGTASIPTAAC